MQDNQYTIRAILNGKMQPVQRVTSLEAAEQYIDEGLGLDGILVRTPLEKKRGRMDANAPVIDYWETKDLLCAGSFRVVIVKTSDLTRELAQ